MNPIQLLPELANKIINEVRLIMREDLIVVDENAMIIASTEIERLGSFHEGARLVMKSKQKFYITEEKVKELEGVKAGINIPIVFEDKVIGVIGITGNPETIEPYADLLRKMTELMIRETYHLEQKEWETRGLEAYFYEWVFSKGVDEAFIHRGQLLGISLGTPHICMLLHVESKHDPQTLQLYMMEWFNKWFPRESSDFFIRWGEDRFLFLKSVKTETSKAYLENELYKWKSYFQSNYQAQVSIGISKSVAKYQLNSAYLEAEKALKVAQNKGDIVFYDSLLLDIILEEVSNDTRTEFISRVLVGIEENKELLQTLRVYLSQNQSIIDTAKELNIHKNTLHYRLRQIKQVTTIDPKDTTGITLFYIALSFFERSVLRS